MKRKAYFFLGLVLFATMLAVTKYALQLYNYRQLEADPCLLKSPNECNAIGVGSDQ